MNSIVKMTENNETSPIKTTQSLIALYCGSRTGNKPIYRDTAIELAQHIATQGFGIVYGGASIGLMGQVADTVPPGSGLVVGVLVGLGEVGFAVAGEVDVIADMALALILLQRLDDICRATHALAILLLDLAQAILFCDVVIRRVDLVL